MKFWLNKHFNSIELEYKFYHKQKSINFVINLIVTFVLFLFTLENLISFSKEQKQINLNSDSFYHTKSNNSSLNQNPND